MRGKIQFIRDFRNLWAGIAAILGRDPRRRRHAWYRLSMICRGIDLSWVSVKDLGLDAKRSVEHGSSGGPDLDSVLRTLPISSADSVLDLGCGKAGAIMTMARYPFSRIDGVELSGDLVQIAQRNLRRMRITNSSITCCDAAEFVDLDRYTYIYMYNPFPGVVMKSVLENIRQSLRRRPRTLTLMYTKAVCDDLVLSSGFRKVKTFDRIKPSCTVYVMESVGSELVSERVEGGSPSKSPLLRG